MLDLGSHAGFIIAAYAVTFIAIAGLAFLVLEDDRKQRRLLAELDRKGIRRRSAQSQAAKPRAKRK